MTADSIGSLGRVGNVNATLIGSLGRIGGGILGEIIREVLRLASTIARTLELRSIIGADNS